MLKKYLWLIQINKMYIFTFSCTVYHTLCNSVFCLTFVQDKA